MYMNMFLFVKSAFLFGQPSHKLVAVDQNCPNCDLASFGSYFRLHISAERNSHYDLMKASYEPRHDKTNKMTVRPAKTQISLGIRPV